jgi:signal transduction histidine kinase
MGETAVRTEPLHDSRLSAFEWLDLPVWILDVEAGHIPWGNQASLAMWAASSLDELMSRNMVESDELRATLRRVIARVSAGERLTFERTIYPKGVPKRMLITSSAYSFADGHVGLLCWARPAPLEASPDVLRGSQAARFAPLIVTTHGLDGRTVDANTLARHLLGTDFTLEEIFPGRAADILRRLAAGESVSAEVELKTFQGRRTYAMEARPMPDPVTGVELVLLIGLDVTARREAEQAKEELVNVVSHELRTPLTSIKGSISLLLHHVVEDDIGKEELLQIASDNVDRLKRLLDDLLDSRRLASGVVELTLARIDLVPLIQRALTLHEPAATPADVALVIAAAPPHAFVLADGPRVLQVLSNLLSNAVKHSPRGGRVEVTITEGERTVRVDVADEGLGVPQDFVPRLFGRFERADGSDARAVGGTGLGLHIAKTLAEAHGGRLGLDQAATRGARFFFELPRDTSS